MFSHASLAGYLVVSLPAWWKCWTWQQDHSKHVLKCTDVPVLDVMLSLHTKCCILETTFSLYSVLLVMDSRSYLSFPFFLPLFNNSLGKLWSWEGFISTALPSSGDRTLSQRQRKGGCWVHSEGKTQLGKTFRLFTLGSIFKEKCSCVWVLCCTYLLFACSEKWGETFFFHLCVSNSVGNTTSFSLHTGISFIWRAVHRSWKSLSPVAPGILRTGSSPCPASVPWECGACCQSHHQQERGMVQDCICWGVC